MVLETSAAFGDGDTDDTEGLVVESKRTAQGDGAFAKQVGGDLGTDDGNFGHTVYIGIRDELADGEGNFSDVGIGGSGANDLGIGIISAGNQSGI